MKLDRNPWMLVGILALVSAGIAGCDVSEPYDLLDTAIPLPPSWTPQPVLEESISSATIDIVSPTPSNTPTSTNTPTASSTASITARPSSTATMTATLAASATGTFVLPTWTKTPTPSRTVIPTKTATLNSSWTPSPAPPLPTLITATPSWIRSETPSRTATTVPPSTPIWTGTFTPTLTWTSISATPSPLPPTSPYATPAPIWTSTFLPSGSPSSTPSWTPSFTETGTPLPPTATATNSALPPSPTSTGCSLVYNSSFEARVIVLINNERAKAGLALLVENAALDSSARTHSIDMALHDFISHTGSDGSSYWDREVRAGYTGHWGGEIIYAGSGTYNSPDQAVSWWMNDPPHKALILADYDVLGAGYAYCPTSMYGGYFTVDFGHR